MMQITVNASLYPNIDNHVPTGLLQYRPTTRGGGHGEIDVAVRRP